MATHLKRIMEDLTFSMMNDTDLEYRQVGDQIEVIDYLDEDGTKPTIVGYINFRKAGT